MEHMDDWDAIPTVVPSKEPPLGGQKQTAVGHRAEGCLATRRRSYMMSCALSWRKRGSRSLLRHSRKLLRVLLGFFSTLI